MSDGGDAISAAAAAKGIVGGFVDMVDGLGAISDIGKALRGGGKAAGGGELGLAIQAATALAQKSIARAAAMQGLEEGLDEAAGSLNPGQMILLEGYVKPAMQAAIQSDPEDFDSGTLIAAAFSAHWAIDQALSDTVESGANAAEDARDEALQEAEDAGNGAE